MRSFFALVSTCLSRRHDTRGKACETSATAFNGLELFDCRFVLPTVFQAQAGKLY